MLNVKLGQNAVVSATPFKLQFLESSGSAPEDAYMDFRDAQEMWTPTDFTRIPQKERLAAGRGREQIRAQIRECEFEIERCARQLRELRLALNRAREPAGSQEPSPPPARSRSVGSIR